MSIRKKYSLYALVNALTAAGLCLAIAKDLLIGIPLLVAVVIIAITGFFALALGISVATKNPKKTFRKIFNIFDLLLIWP